MQQGQSESSRSTVTASTSSTPSAPFPSPSQPLMSASEAGQHGSRRARRDAARPTRRRSRTAVVTGQWAPRAAVLAALATATIAVPLGGTVSAADEAAPDQAAVTVAVGPSAYEVLASTVEQTTPTSLLAGVPGAERATETVSRSLDRDPLPGCDGLARPASSNGQVPSADLCALWDPSQMLRGDAAVALSELNLGFRAAFGRDMCITDSYRSLAMQRQVAYAKPGLAASPGTSNHGWGLAIDFCSSETRSSTVMSWMQENAPIYGWDNPKWARRGGSGAYEPWHWEFVPGTTALGTNY